MSSSEWIYDRDADLCLDWDSVQDEDAQPRLELRMVDSGCSCCQVDATFYGQEDMVKQLVRHGEYFQKRAAWYMTAASLLTEYGEARVNNALILVERISRLIDDATSKARRLEKGTLKEHRYHQEWLKEIGDLHPASAIFNTVREAMKDYAKLGTAEKQIAEHFEQHSLHWIGKNLAELVGYGYQLDGDAASLAKENQDE